MRHIARFINIAGAYIIAFILALLIVVVLPELMKTKEKVNKPSKITEQDVRDIYAHLIKFTGLTSGGAPSLEMSNDTIINAFADGVNFKIIMTKGMINYVKSKDEMAYVLSHELGHILLSHSTLSGNFQSALLEGNADKFSTYLMVRAGYDICKSRDLWIRLRWDNGDLELNSTHPNYSHRIWELNYPQCPPVKWKYS